PDPEDSSESGPCLLPGPSRLYPFVLVRKPASRPAAARRDLSSATVHVHWTLRSYARVEEARCESASNHTPECSVWEAADADHRPEDLCDVRWLAEPDFRQAVRGRGAHRPGRGDHCQPRRGRGR